VRRLDAAFLQRGLTRRVVVLSSQALRKRRQAAAVQNGGDFIEKAELQARPEFLRLGAHRGREQSHGNYVECGGLTPLSAAQLEAPQVARESSGALAATNLFFC
jgi:hypothetical protein